MKKLSIKLYLVFYCTMIGLATSCITPYEPDVEWINDLLVVEGAIIAPYGTIIHINRTNEGSSSFYDPNLTNKKAVVTLISDKGTTIATAQNTTGSSYMITDSISFKPGEKYAIHFLINGKEYQSDFVEPQITPEIDEVNYQYKELEEVDIRVSTHNDDPDASRYYRWTYKEDWEIVSEYFAQYTWSYENGIQKLNQFSPENVHYCWASKTSNRILSSKSDNFSENKIKDHTILSLGAADSRFSYLYSISIQQQALDRKAYEYLENMRKNVEQTGGIFAPQPTEIKGNITCLSNPEEIIIGYIYATTETSYRLYIKAEDVPGMTDIYDCREKQLFSGRELEKAYGQGFAILSEGAVSGTYFCMNRRCVDCRSRGGTKNKPDFWPNNHQ